MTRSRDRQILLFFFLAYHFPGRTGYRCSCAVSASGRILPRRISPASSGRPLRPLR